MRQFVKRYRKAIAGALAGGAVAIGASLDHGTITADEWGVILAGIVAGALGVGFAPANEPRRRHRRARE